MIAAVTMELTPPETTRLAELEAVIKDGLMTFIDVGASLLEIRNSRLYRHEYSTFEQYCREKWQMTRRYANDLIQAHEVITNLSPKGGTNLGTIVPIPSDLTPIGVIPTKESQVRPLAKLAPDKQREAWQKAVDTAPAGKVTSKHVEKVVAEMKQEVKADPALSFLPPAMRKNFVSEAMGIATFVIVHLERIKREDPKRADAIDKVVQWCIKNK